MEKIIASQYVDFSKLPPDKGRTHPLSSQEDGHVLVIYTGRGPCEPALRNSYQIWPHGSNQCFAIYVAVAVDSEPELIKSLLAYMTTIAKVTIKYTWPSSATSSDPAKDRMFTQLMNKMPLPHSNPQACRRYNAFNGDGKFGEGLHLLAQVHGQ